MRSCRTFGCFDSQYTPFKQQKPHSIIFTRSWVFEYITFAHERTDGQTCFEKVLFFSADQEYIYMSIPISTISQISSPFWPKLAYLFFLWKWVWNKKNNYFYKLDKLEMHVLHVWQFCLFTYPLSQKWASSLKTIFR